MTLHRRKHDLNKKEKCLDFILNWWPVILSKIDIFIIKKIFTTMQRTVEAMHKVQFSTSAANDRVFVSGTQLTSSRSIF